MNCNIKSYTPSFLFAWDDPVLNYATLKMFMKYYVADHCDATKDCYISPLLTPDWILEQYPEIAMGVSEYDPLRDDAFRLAKRLLLLEKEIDIIYARFLRHDPICFTIRGSPIGEAFKYLDKTMEIFSKWINKRKKAYALKGKPSINMAGTIAEFLGKEFDLGLSGIMTEK